MARMMNEMALHSFWLTDHVREVGVRAFVHTFFAAMKYVPLEAERLQGLLTRRYQLRLVWESDWKTKKIS